jgi:transcriptional regulator with XRE-family HTH domain
MALNPLNYQDLLIIKLKKIIKEKFKSQKICAEKVDINEAQIARWMTKKAIPSLEILNRIAEYCNLPVSYFFEDNSLLDSHNVIDEDIFNKVFELAYNLAIDKDLEINGAFFLGCYDLVIEAKNKDNSQDVEAIFNTLKPFILKLVKKR